MYEEGINKDDSVPKISLVIPAVPLQLPRVNRMAGAGVGEIGSSV